MYVVFTPGQQHQPHIKMFIPFHLVSSTFISTFYFYLFIYLVALDLSCGRQNLQSSLWHASS